MEAATVAGCRVGVLAVPWQGEEIERVAVSKAELLAELLAEPVQH